MTYKLTRFLGINTRLPDSALHVRTRQVQGDYLRNAVNVDIDNAGRLLRRRDLALVQAMIGAHSLRMAGDTAGYLVRDSVLYAITLPTYSEAVVKLLTSDAPMSYAEVNDDLYYSNGADSGRITAGVVYPLGLPTPATPAVSVIGGGLLPGWYQIGVGYANTTTGEEGGISASANIELTSEGGIRVVLPAATPGATHINVYLSATNGEVPYLATTAVVGTAQVDLTALATGRESNGRYEGPLPAGRLFLSSGRLCSYSGDKVYLGLPFRPGYYLPLEGYIAFPADVSVAVDAQAGIFVAADKTYWVPNEGVVSDVLPYGAVPGTEFSYPDRSIYGWFGAKGFVLGKPNGEVDAVMSDNIALTPPTSGFSAIFEDDDDTEFRRVVSCGWSMNLANQAVTRYEDWGVTSASRGYATKSDGVYSFADGGNVTWLVDFGKVDLGNDLLKYLPTAYLGVESEDTLLLTVNDEYSYPSRTYDEALGIQRIDVGKGLRAAWFGLKLSGTEGADFRLAYIDFTPATTTRRV